MPFQSRDEFINAQASEKITLAHVHATTRLIVWSDDGGGLYSKTVPYFVSKMQIGNTQLTRVSDLGSVTPGTFYYSPQLGKVYINNPASENPNDNEMIVTYRFFYADSTLVASWDLSNTGTLVQYTGLIISSPGYKQKVGIDQSLISLVGSGTLAMRNDKTFDEIYDKLYFENQQVSIYSWNRELDFSDAKLIFRGRVSDKYFGNDRVSFKIKDNIFDLNQAIPQKVYTDDDNVASTAKGQYKRWVYGRVDGLKLQSIDQIGNGYQIAGTGSLQVGSLILTGSGTSFRADTSPGDSIIVGTQEFTIEVVQSDTSILLSDEPSFSVSAAPIVLNPEIPTTVKNRTFLVADHTCTQLTKTVVDPRQLNKIQLSDVDGLLVGDLIEFSTGERVEILKFNPDNVVVLVQNLLQRPAIGTSVTRQPIQKVYLDSKLVGSDDFTINNGSQLTVTLDQDTEFNLAKVRGLNQSFTFTNGFISVSYTGESLESVLSPRDWIRPQVGTGEYYEILFVSENNIVLRTPFNQPTTTTSAQYKSPDYIGDNSVLSVDVLGRTEDGTADGRWIKTAPQVIKDILSEIGLEDINVDSFTLGEKYSPQIISLPIPVTPSRSATTAKVAIDAINKSVLGSLTTDNDLKIKYDSLLAIIDDNVQTISDREIIKWSVKSISGRIYQKAVVNYRHTDVDRATGEEGASVVTSESDFVKNYIGTTVSSELDARLYSTIDAQIRANREVYYNRLSKTEITLIGDLRLDVYEIGDSIKLDIERLYTRLGDSNTRQKIMKIVGKSTTGTETTLILNDVANIYNVSSIITPNTAPDYSAATSEDKIKYGYITDNQGVVEDDEDTANIHLIS